jgi:hypothetical protein
MLEMQQEADKAASSGIYNCSRGIGGEARDRTNLQLNRHNIPEQSETIYPSLEGQDFAFSKGSNSFRSLQTQFWIYAAGMISYLSENSHL